MSKIYISDTNIWIDFRNAGLLEELFRLPLTLCCTDFVLHGLKDLPCEELIDNRRSLRASGVVPVSLEDCQHDGVLVECISQSTRIAPSSFREPPGCENANISARGAFCWTTCTTPLGQRFGNSIAS